MFWLMENSNFTYNDIMTLPYNFYIDFLEFKDELEKTKKKRNEEMNKKQQEMGKKLEAEQRQQKNIQRLKQNTPHTINRIKR